MSLKEEVLDALVAAGATAEMIVAAIKADKAARAHERELAAERQRRKRQRNAESRVTERDTALRVSRQESFPQTPFQETQLPESPPSPPKGGSSPVKSDFDQFWKAYPHKVGKRAAEVAFRHAKTRGADVCTLLGGLDRYVETKPPDRPWCNPATWLNQDRWLDEPNVVPLLARATGPPDAAAMREEGRRRLLARYANEAATNH